MNEQIFPNKLTMREELYLMLGNSPGPQSTYSPVGEVI